MNCGEVDRFVQGSFWSVGPVDESGCLNSTTVGISCEEEPVEWTAEDHENICDNIFGKRLSLEAVQIGRREDFEFMDRLASWKKLWLDGVGRRRTRSPFERSGLTSTRGDGDRVEICSRLVATELKVHQIKMGKSHKIMFIDINGGHFHSPSRRRVFVELPPERERSGWC